jgi:hypothetical protein
MSEKPMGVMPLCIIAIFLGIMGILGGAMGVLGLVMDQQKMAPDKDPKLTELNAEFERRMQAFMKETRPLSLVVIPSVMLTSALLAAAGLAGINLKGLGFLKLAFVVNLLVDLGSAVFQSIAQVKSIAIMKWYLAEVTAAHGSGGASSAVEMSMQFGLYTSLFFGVFWLVLKLAYYVVGIVYFNKRAIVDAYAGRPAPDAAV